MTTATPLARYGAMWKARVASGYATPADLHHVQGHDLLAPQGRAVITHASLNTAMSPSARGPHKFDGGASVSQTLKALLAINIFAPVVFFTSPNEWKPLWGACACFLSVCCFRGDSIADILCMACGRAAERGEFRLRIRPAAITETVHPIWEATSSAKPSSAVANSADRSESAEPGDRSGRQC
jgi:hypothetical protein